MTHFIRISVPHPLRGSARWIRSVDPLRGSAPWIRSVDPLRGSAPWIRSVDPFRGSAPWIRSVDPLRGSAPWIRSVPHPLPHFNLIVTCFTITTYSINKTLYIALTRGRCENPECRNLVPRAFPFLSLGRREKALAPGGLLCILIGQ
jgi:hypothetical protein